MNLEKVPIRKAFKECRRISTVTRILSNELSEATEKRLFLIFYLVRCKAANVMEASLYLAEKGPGTMGVPMHLERLVITECTCLEQNLKIAFAETKVSSFVPLNDAKSSNVL